MKISVIIPTFDELEWISGALESAMVPGIEVLVVDGGSRDGSALRARQTGVRVLAAGRMGPCSDFGGSYATKEWILYRWVLGRYDWTCPSNFFANVGIQNLLNQKQLRTD